MYGQYLCCGQVPLFGHHHHHSWRDKDVLHENMHGFGHYCPSCHQSASVLDSQDWTTCTRVWNAKLHTDPYNPPPVNAPVGYHYAALEATTLFLGVTVRMSSEGILFRTPGSFKDFQALLIANSQACDEKDAYLPGDLELLSLDGKLTHTFDMTKRRGIYAKLSARSALFGGTTITLDITTLQNRTGWDLRNFCEKLGLEEY